MLVQLALLFARLSLFAIGGMTSTLPEISAQVVTARHWLSPAQFTQLYGISNAAPGPNMLFATVIGAHQAGIAGGLVASLAMILPAGCIAMMVGRFWERYREARLRKIIQTALLPLTAGLVLAAGVTLVRQSDTNIVFAVLSLAVTYFAWRTRVHPLWLLSAALCVGLVSAWI